MPRELLVLTAAAARLGVPPNTLRGWARNGLIAYHQARPRGRRLFDRDDLDAFLAARRIAAKSERTSPAPRGGYRNVDHLMPAVRDLRA